MAIHSSILAWIIPWTEKPGGLQSMESKRVGCEWATNNTHIINIQYYLLQMYNIVIHNFKGYTPFIVIIEY